MFLKTQTRLKKFQGLYVLIQKLDGYPAYEYLFFIHETKMFANKHKHQ